MADSRALGIFDSGLGGLTLVNALRQQLPGESFIYVGDTARIPYGEKTVTEIHTYARQILTFLQEKDVKATIVACGTISSNVMNELRAEFPLHIIDVISPNLNVDAKVKRLGIIATVATVKSGFIEKKLREARPNLEVESIACPLFVQLIEEGAANSALAKSIVAEYLRPWQKAPVDAVLLACTHYPLLAPLISQVLPNVQLINMADATITEAQNYLTHTNQLNKQKTAQEFYVSGSVEKFNQMAAQITGNAVMAQRINW